MTVRVNVNILRNLTSLFLAIAFTTKNMMGTMPWFYPYLICAPLYVILLLAFIKHGEKQYLGLSKMVFELAIIPYVIAIIYSFAIHGIYRDVVNSGTRSVSVTVQEAFDVSLAILLFLNFKKDTIKILENAVIFSYLYTLVIAYINIGMSGIIRYLSTVYKYDTKLNIWFEMHDIGLSVGFFLLYELLIAEEKDLFRFALMSIIFMFCFKRIAIFAFGIVWIIGEVLRRVKKGLRILLIKVIMVGLLSSCMIYIALLSTGSFYDLAGKFGFDFSNRRYLFSYASSLYDFSFGFLGHGLGFSAKYFSFLAHSSLRWKVGGFFHIHNDILKMYIDLGFVGSFLWFLWYTVIFPSLMSRQKCGEEGAYIYCLAMLYAFSVYTTDNASVYFLFQMTLYSLIMQGYCQKLTKTEFTAKDKKTSLTA